MATITGAFLFVSTNTVHTGTGTVLCLFVLKATVSEHQVVIIFPLTNWATEHRAALISWGLSLKESSREHWANSVIHMGLQLVRVGSVNLDTILSIVNLVSS